MRFSVSAPSSQYLDSTTGQLTLLSSMTSLTASRISCQHFHRKKKKNRGRTVLVLLASQYAVCLLHVRRLSIQTHLFKMPPKRFQEEKKWEDHSLPCTRGPPYIHAVRFVIVLEISRTETSKDKARYGRFQV